MADVHNEATRRYNMSQIKYCNSLPEKTVRSFLWHNGIRYRINYRSLPGKPDIVIINRKITIFIHGCFWHGHEGCKYFKIPETNTEWWTAKINETKKRDTRNLEILSQMGWTVITLYECELKNKTRQAKLEALLAEIH